MITDLLATLIDPRDLRVILSGAGNVAFVALFLAYAWAISHGYSTGPR